MTIQTPPLSLCDVIARIESQWRVTQAELEYRNFRHGMMQREDWGRLPSDLHARLFALHRAYIEGRGK